MWSIETINKAFRTFLPDINDLFKQGEGLYNTPKEREFIDHIYQVCR
jgi:mannose-1-phosphate guanylyltransferase